MSNSKKNRSAREEVTLAGSELVDYVKKVLAEGHVRRLIIRKPDGETLMEVPLAAGLVVGGALTVMAPLFAALGAMAALLAQVKLEIIRTDDDS